VTGLPAPSHPDAWPRDRVFAPGLRPLVSRLIMHPHDIPAHAHDFAEIVVGVWGSCLQDSPQGQQPLDEQAVAVLRPWSWHDYRQMHEFTGWVVCVGREVIHRELGWIAGDPLLARAAWWLEESRTARPQVAILRPDPAILLRLRHCCAELAQATAAGGAAGGTPFARLLELLELLAPLLPTPATSTGDAPTLVTEAARLMETALDQAWTLAGLATRLRIDRTHLARTFRRAHGLPPMAWLARRRAEEAARMLDASDWPVTRIAAAVGWPQPHHFARRFRAHFGLSASAYRLRSRSRSPHGA
jgi:AraC family L-rhamnose operon transcriptional activator RhaR